MKIIRTAAISGILCVVLGAFGAHTLKTIISPDQLLVFETGIRYQFYHTMALLFCGVLANTRQSRQINLAAGSFTAGIIFFSGSLYLLSVRFLLGIEHWSWLGPITPLGGMMFVMGWIFLLLHSLKSNP